MLELEHGAIVDRNACVFCHLGLYRNGTFVIEQVRPLSLFRHSRLIKPAALFAANSHLLRTARASSLRLCSAASLFQRLSKHQAATWALYSTAHMPCTIA